MEKKTVKWLGLLAAVLSLLVVAIVAAGAFYVLVVMDDGPDPEEEYYRAMFDVCVAQMGDRALCLRSVAGYRERGWYEEPSAGWRWPPAVVSPAIPGNGAL